MNGVDPHAYMQEVAAEPDRTRDPWVRERMLGDLDYLIEIMDPEIQGLAEDLMQRLRAGLKALRAG